MVKLLTFGGVDVHDELGRRVNALTAQPRRLALLAYLCVEGIHRPISRDVVVTMFWPDVDSTRASKSLSQALLHIKKAVGSDICSHSGRDIQISPEAIWCDSVELISLYERGENLAATRLYTGDFLQGFYIADGGEFEHWCDGARRRLQHMASEAAFMAAEVSAARDDLIDAATLARRAVEIECNSELAAQRQVEFLHRIGDTSGALTALAAIRNHLETELECNVSPKTLQLESTLRAHAKASVEIPLAVPPQHVELPLPSDDQPTPRPFYGHAVRWLATSTVSLIFLMLWGLRHAGAPPPPHDDAQLRVFVDSFRQAPSDYPLLPGAAYSISNHTLGALADVGAIATYQGFGPTLAATPRGRGTPLILRGHLLHIGNDNARLTVVVADGLSGRVISTSSFPVDLSDAGSYERVGVNVADFTRQVLGRDIHREQIRLIVDRATAIRLEESRRGRSRADSLRRSGSPKVAAALLTAIDSSLAYTSARGATRNEVRTERAEIAIALAWTQFALPVPDFREARRSFRTALILADSILRIDHRHAGAWDIRGTALHFLSQTAPSDSTGSSLHFLAASDSSLHQSLQIASMRPRPWALLSASAQLRGDYVASRAAAERAYRADAFLEQAPDVLHRLFATSLETSDISAAVGWCEEIDRRFHRSWISTLCNLELAARDPDVDAGLRRAQTIIESDSVLEKYPTMLNLRAQVILAAAAARAGRTDLVMKIDRTAAARESQDPELAPFRSWVWFQAGRTDSARVILGRYVAQDPVRRAALLRSVRFSWLDKDRPPAR